MLDFLTSNDILWNTITVDSTQNGKFLVRQRVCSNAVNAGFCLPDCHLLSFCPPQLKNLDPPVVTFYFTLKVKHLICHHDESYHINKV